MIVLITVNHNHTHFLNSSSCLLLLYLMLEDGFSQLYGEGFSCPLLFSLVQASQINKTGTFPFLIDVLNGFGTHSAALILFASPILRSE